MAAGAPAAFQSENTRVRPPIIDTQTKTWVLYTGLETLSKEGYWFIRKSAKESYTYDDHRKKD